jgi:hypothetical protein
VRFGKLALAALLLPLAGSAASVSIDLDNGVFKVIGWQPSSDLESRWSSIFMVYAGGGAAGADLPPIFGSYSVENGALTFRPRSPLEGGVTYRAVFHPPGMEAIEATFSQPAQESRQATRTHVVAVYPSTNVLPENQLKLYVYFSAPMQSGGVWPKIHLLEEDGRPVVLPFVELEQELWDREQKRLTLLFDPGRIKRGVKPNVDMGPVLREGKRYTLVIDPELQDGRGLQLASAFRREFSVGPAERRGIDPKQWKISAPKAGTSDPLIVDFGRPLDYALLQDVFQVPGVAGKMNVGSGETQWRLHPSQPWKSGNHTLVIDMALEDLAGNRIGRPFDVDTVDNPTQRITKSSMRLTFKVP